MLIESPFLNEFKRNFLASFHMGDRVALSIQLFFYAIRIQLQLM